MAKQFRRVAQKAKENKSGAGHISNPMKTNQKLECDVAEVTQIVNNGFWLRVSGVDYFLSFSNFPWFRYASDTDIKCIRVSYHDNDDFLVYWCYLDVHLPKEGIEWHMQNPVKKPHPIMYPLSDGKLSNRIPDTTVKRQRYEVETTFVFKGKIRVVAESADHARRTVQQRCRMQGEGLVVDVHIPFEEISWDFPFRTKEAETKIGRVRKVK